PGGGTHGLGAARAPLKSGVRHARIFGTKASRATGFFISVTAGFAMARVEELSIEDIRKRYVESGEPIPGQILGRLQKDPRLGVQKLYAALRKRYEREQKERTRLDAMRHFELVLWKSGVRDIAGVDEAGVAPLAGPVVAAAVVFEPGTDIAGIDDSKKLDAPTRARLAKEIRPKATGVRVGISPVEA